MIRTRPGFAGSRGALAYMGGGWGYLTVGKGMVWVAA